MRKHAVVRAHPQAADCGSHVGDSSLQRPTVRREWCCRTGIPCHHRSLPLYFLAGGFGKDMRPRGTLRDSLVLGVFGGVLRAPISPLRVFEYYALRAETHGGTSTLGFVSSAVPSSLFLSPAAIGSVRCEHSPHISQDPLNRPEAPASLEQDCEQSSTSLGGPMGQELSATLADNTEIQGPLR